MLLTSYLPFDQMLHVRIRITHNQILYQYKDVDGIQRGFICIFFYGYDNYKYLCSIACWRAAGTMEEYIVKWGVYERNSKDGEYNQKIR